MTEFISRNHGHSCYEIIIKTTSHEHYNAAEDFARRLIGHGKPVTDNNVGSKWIPVTERLPEVRAPVLIAIHQQRDVFARVGWVHENGMWSVSTTRKWLSEAVTHWMLLPEPPKMEG